MKLKLIVFAIFLSTLASLLAREALAQSLILKSTKTSYQVGDSFAVSLTLDTEGQFINTVSGKIMVSAANLQILDVRYGNSIVSLWIERPKVDAGQGAITFTGGVPGGFSGSQGPILSFGVKASAEGEAKIGFEEVKVLLNDGKGTEVAVSHEPLVLTIKKAPPPPPKPAEPEKKLEPEAPPPPVPEEVYAPPPDTIPPEPFFPLVSRHPSVADNKYFISFFTVDKDSGISRYEVREEPRLWPFGGAEWIPTESPYVLRGQFWTHNILIRAYDQAGNVREGSVVKPLNPLVSAALGGLLVILTVLATRFLHLSRKRTRRKT